jgi:3-methyl-2-oxobutanoate hydroxymethyltransferase
MLSVLTAYDFNTARALTEAGIDVILVGDSLAVVALGYTSTAEVSLEEMLILAKAVVRGAGTDKASQPSPKIVVDLPYVSACKDLDGAVTDALKLIDTGANCIKIENAEASALNLISTLAKQGVEVMGHLGYTPQSIHKPKVMRDREGLLFDAHKLVAAGVSSMVLEMVSAELAKEITEAIPVPIIGIGSGPYTSGQVLVSDDVLGRYNLLHPKFLRRYAHQYDESVTAFKAYIQDVKAGKFPSEQESYFSEQVTVLQ